MNLHGVWAIYRFEMARALRTLWQSLVAPVLTTSLYFIVFGGAIGSRMQTVDGVGYGSFIVPGLIMLSLLTQSVGNASIGIYFPKFTGTIFELLSAPVSAMEMVLGYVGAAATKSVVLGVIILVTSAFFVPIRVDHPAAMVAFLLLTAIGLVIFVFTTSRWRFSTDRLARPGAARASRSTARSTASATLSPDKAVPVPWQAGQWAPVAKARFSRTRLRVMATMPNSDMGEICTGVRSQPRLCSSAATTTTA
jgi:hypothetical protein